MLIVTRRKTYPNCPVYYLIFSLPVIVFLGRSKTSADWGQKGGKKEYLSKGSRRFGISVCSLHLSLLFSFPFLPLSYLYLFFSPFLSPLFLLSLTLTPSLLVSDLNFTYFSPLHLNLAHHIFPPLAIPLYTLLFFFPISPLSPSFLTLPTYCSFFTTFFFLNLTISFSRQMKTPGQRER